jgi:hypothetical protein
MREVLPRRIVDGIFGGCIGAGVGWLFLHKQFVMWGFKTSAEIVATLLGILVGGLIALLLSPYLRTQSQQRKISPYGAIVSLLAVFLWLIPMGMTGTFKSKLYTVPAFVRNQYRISCLFTNSSKYWHTVHYQVRLNGQTSWQEGPLEGFFELDLFGYRSKLNRIVLASRYKNKRGRISGRNKKRLIELANFIGTRWEELYPSDSDVRQVRFYRVGHRVGEQHCMAREAWSRPPLDTIPENKRELLISISLDDI